MRPCHAKNITQLGMHFEKFQNSMDRMNPDWTDKNMKNFETSSVTNSTNFYIAKFRLLNNLQLIFKYLFFYFPCVPNATITFFLRLWLLVSFGLVVVCRAWNCKLKPPYRVEPDRVVSSLWVSNRPDWWLSRMAYVLTEFTAKLSPRAAAKSQPGPLGH